jgi:hypothetical protein
MHFRRTIDRCGSQRDCILAAKSLTERAFLTSPPDDK